jgi:hypothetical protein
MKPIITLHLQAGDFSMATSSSRHSQPYLFSLVTWTSLRYFLKRNERSMGPIEIPFTGRINPIQSDHYVQAAGYFSRKETEKFP